MATRLHNLDELVGSVRDAQSRAYLEEAIAAHRAGANRAAIVTLWTTIVYDLIQKVRELANGGDASAVAFVQAYEAALKRNDIPRLLKIEGDIVETAYREFEMLQPHEVTALTRIQADRHLCAHPAMTVTDTLFQPTPDLVQSYVVNAVTYLLAHQPMQGKSALERICADVVSPAFPTDPDMATRYLADRYLKRAKASLVRNLTIVLLKKHLGQAAAFDVEAFSLALEAGLRTCRAECEAVIEDKLAGLAGVTAAPLMLNVLALVDLEPRCWDWCDEPTRIIVRELLRKGQYHASYTARILRGASRVGELATMLTEGYAQLDDAQRLRLAELSPRREYVGPSISRFAAASSFRDAGAVGQRAIVPLAPLMTASEVQEVIVAVRGNGQVYRASGTPDVLAAVFEATRQHLPATFEAWKMFVDERRAIERDPRSRFAYPDIAQKLELYRPGSMSA